MVTEEIKADKNRQPFLLFITHSVKLTIFSSLSVTFLDILST